MRFRVGPQLRTARPPGPARSAAFSTRVRGRRLSPEPDGRSAHGALTRNLDRSPTAALLSDRTLRPCRRTRRADQIVADAAAQPATVQRGIARFPPVCTKSQKLEEFLCPMQA